MNHQLFNELSEQQIKLLNTGTYYKKLLKGPNKILTFGHKSRFIKAFNLINKYNANSIIDYGCGDATFLILMDQYITNKVGIEIDTNSLELLKTRFKNKQNFNFYHSSKAPENQQYDILTCMEVLEHCRPDTIDELLKKFLSMLKNDGKLIISVPIEIGPSLIIKQFVRYFLAKIKYGNYEHSENYNLRELIKAFFATKNTLLKRKYYPVVYNKTEHIVCGHKGFNWRFLLKTIKNDYKLEKLSFSPFIFPGGFFSSQAWFILTKKKKH